MKNYSAQWLNLIEKMFLTHGKGRPHSRTYVRQAILSPTLAIKRPAITLTVFNG